MFRHKRGRARARGDVACAPRATSGAGGRGKGASASIQLAMIRYEEIRSLTSVSYNFFLYLNVLILLSSMFFITKALEKRCVKKNLPLFAQSKPKKTL